jgi:hypothetical protein
MRRRSKIIRIVLISVASLLAFVLLFVGSLAAVFRCEINAIKYVYQKDEDGFFLMNYTLDYDLDGLMSRGASTDQEYVDYITDKLFKGLPIHIDIAKYACSTFSAATPEGGYLFGRNFDWCDSPSMLVFTTPKNGYASLSMVNLGFLTYDKTYLPDKYLNRLMTLAAPYVPVDGMNEKGLAIGVLYLESEPTAQNTPKTDVTTTAMIRIVLDRAANVQEALALFNQFDMHDSAGACYHYQIMDASGASVIVEYVNNQMRVLYPEYRDNGYPYLCATNFFLSPDGDNSKPFGEDRYEILQTALAASCGTLSASEAMNLLKSARITSYVWPDGWEDSTQWSAVYDLAQRTVHICVGMKYDKQHTYSVHSNFLP